MSRLEIRIEPTPHSSAVMVIKRWIQFGFQGLVLPRLLSYWLARAWLGERAFMASSESIARLPGMRGVYMRQAFYGATLQVCGRDVSIGWNSIFSRREASLGERVYIGHYCCIGFADIGDEAMLADRVQILSGGREHDRGDSGLSLHEQGQTYTQVQVGEGAWVGTGAIVMADVGEHAIIGAGSVVNRPIPAGAIAVGVPAQVVKWRDGWSEMGRIAVNAEDRMS